MLTDIEPPDQEKKEYDKIRFRLTMRKRRMKGHVISLRPHAHVSMIGKKKEY
jgi:hypothetical protein